MLATFGPQPMGAEGEAVVNAVQARVGNAHQRAASERQVLQRGEKWWRVIAVSAGVLRNAGTRKTRVSSRRVRVLVTLPALIAQAGISAKLDAWKQELEAGSQCNASVRGSNACSCAINESAGSHR